MSAITDARLDRARQLLQAGRDELARAEEAKGQAAVIGLQNSCGKGWLATLEAVNAHLIGQGIAESALPRNERGRRYFTANYLNREMQDAYERFRNTFHIDGYYEGIVAFDAVPRYFDLLDEFIDRIRQSANGGGV